MRKFVTLAMLLLVGSGGFMGYVYYSFQNLVHAYDNLEFDIKGAEISRGSDHISLNLTINVHNPSSTGLKIPPIDLNIYVNDTFLGYGTFLETRVPAGMNKAGKLNLIFNYVDIGHTAVDIIEGFLGGGRCLEIRVKGVAHISFLFLSFDRKVSKTKTITIPIGADFTLSASVDEITIPRGNSDTVTITVQSLNSFNSPVTLRCPSPLTGVDVSFDPQTVTPPADGSATSHLTISVGEHAVLPTRPLEIIGTSGILPDRVCTIWLHIGEKPALTVALLGPRNGATTSVSEVELRAEVTSGVLPVPGATVKFYIDGEYVDQSTSGTLGVASYTHAFPEGSHTWYVTAEKEGYGSDTSSIRSITYEAPFKFSISISPSSRTVTKGDSTTYTVTITLLSGSPQTVWLTVTGLPSATKSFSLRSGSPTFTSILTVDTTIATLKGTHTLTIRAANLAELIIREATVEITVT